MDNMDVAVAKLVTALTNAAPQVTEIGLEVARLMAIADFAKAIACIISPFVAYYALPKLFRCFVKDPKNIDKDSMIFFGICWLFAIGFFALAAIVHVVKTAWVAVVVGMFRPELYLAYMVVSKAIS